MGQALTPGLTIARRTVVRKLRELPLAGELLVPTGARVSPGTVVARAHLPGDLMLLRIPEKLGIEPFEVLKNLTVKAGDTVTAGQVLCEHRGLFGLFGSRFVAPQPGTIELITERTGHVGLRLAPKLIELRAYLTGEVVALEARKSVTIESRAALVQGIIGVGGERNGVLRLLPGGADTRITEELIPADAAGQVLVGGTRPTAAALKRAAAAGAVGMIAGAIEDAALAGYLGYDLGLALTGDEDLPMTLILSEGFGEMAIGRKAYELLSSLAGSACAINGATQVRAGAVRPEIIVFLEDTADRPVPAATAAQEVGLDVGSEVRIIRVPWFGQLAVVEELPKEPERIETGAYCRVLRARLAGGELVTVPRANVELM